MNIPKFRAWDKVNKKMLEVNVIDFNFEKIRIINDNGHCISVDFKNIELMQSTGLKDKNGVEIFERDIVRIDNKNYSVKRERITGIFIIDTWDFPQRPLYKHLKKSKVVGNLEEGIELQEV